MKQQTGCGRQIMFYENKPITFLQLPGFLCACFCCLFVCFLVILALLPCSLLHQLEKKNRKFPHPAMPTSCYHISQLPEQVFRFPGAS